MPFVFSKELQNTLPNAQGFSELALRARLLAAIKRTCRFEKPLLVLTGLKEAICPTGKRWTTRRAAKWPSLSRPIQTGASSRSIRPSHQKLKTAAHSQAPSPCPLRKTVLSPHRKDHRR